MRWPVGGALLATGLLLLPGCGSGDRSPRPFPAPPVASLSGGRSPASGPTAALVVTSSAFGDGAPIPDRYSCRGDNTPPPLAWTAPPPGTGALALVVDDPDAVGGTYIHWVVTDIPPGTTGSPEGAAPSGGRVSTNSGGKAAYLGPCPPRGTGVHHYRFTVYALPRPLGLSQATPARQAVGAIAAAATAQGRVVGTFTG